MSLSTGFESDGKDAGSGCGSTCIAIVIVWIHRRNRAKFRWTVHTRISRIHLTMRSCVMNWQIPVCMCSQKFPAPSVWLCGFVCVWGLFLSIPNMFCHFILALMCCMCVSKHVLIKTKWNQRTRCSKWSALSHSLSDKDMLFIIIFLYQTHSTVH